MGRRPVEDEREQDERGHTDVARDRRPPDHWRQGTRRTPDDDVLRRASLQEGRIDDDVEGDGKQRQECGQEVDERHEHRE